VSKFPPDAHQPLRKMDVLGRSFAALKSRAPLSKAFGLDFFWTPSPLCCGGRHRKVRGCSFDGFRHLGKSHPKGEVT
ncbi:MAG: hypothetical protein K2W93_15150, partial [Burkholderiaceae bacterium]|nr:hypothetical protein [Burkholderiaceae bacterium]